jgi:hypothetical protein
MIVVRVELHSARTHTVTELARMKICNIGGDHDHRDYSVETLKGRSRAALDKDHVNRHGEIKNHPSPTIHVWYLIAKALAAVNYK